MMDQEPNSVCFRLLHGMFKRSNNLLILLLFLLYTIVAWDHIGSSDSLPDTDIRLAIDISSNTLYVYKGDQVFREYPVVTGRIEEPSLPGVHFDFKTPRGVFKIISIVKNPAWCRPDWYWLERGLSPPSRSFQSSRVLFGCLGEYKLCWGDGYCIHGTPSGKISRGNHSHGCIRMNSDDLLELVTLVGLGTEVSVIDRI